MCTKRNILVVISVAWGCCCSRRPGVSLLLPLAGAASSPDVEWRLDGAWIMRFKANGGALDILHNSFNVAQDAQGLKYTTYVEHSQCSPSVWGTFMQANAHSQMIGVAEKTGPATFKGTMVHYGLKTGGLQDEVVYLAVTSWEATLADEDHAVGKGTQAFYLPGQDADHDGLPDNGQYRVFCAV